MQIVFFVDTYEFGLVLKIEFAIVCINSHNFGSNRDYITEHSK